MKKRERDGLGVFGGVRVWAVLEGEREERIPSGCYRLQALSGKPENSVSVKGNVVFLRRGVSDSGFCRAAECEERDDSEEDDIFGRFGFNLILGWIWNSFGVNFRMGSMEAFEHRETTLYWRFPRSMAI